MTRPNPEFPAVLFEVGRTYETLGGDTVDVVATGHESVGVQTGLLTTGWRYNRPGATDHGRTTGTNHDFTDQRNLIPEDEDGRQHPYSLIEGVPGVRALLDPVPEVILMQPKGAKFTVNDMTVVDVYVRVFEYDGHATYEKATVDTINQSGLIAQP